MVTLSVKGTIYLNKKLLTLAVNGQPSLRYDFLGSCHGVSARSYVERGHVMLGLETGLAMLQSPAVYDTMMRLGCPLIRAKICEKFSFLAEICPSFVKQLTPYCDLY
jgi:hypothetical protein